MTGQSMISFTEQGRSDREGVGVTDDVAISFEIQQQWLQEVSHG